MRKQAAHEARQRRLRSGVWKLVHYVLLASVAAYGAVSGGVILTSSGVDKDVAGLLLLGGAVLAACAKGFDALSRMTANLLSRNEWERIGQEAGDACHGNLGDLAKSEELARLRTWASDRSDRDARSRT